MIKKLPILLLFTALSLPSIGQSAAFERSQFLSDPYLPLSSYPTNEALVKDFEERFSGTYVRDSDPKLESEAQKLIDHAYEGFKAAFPQFMANKAKPQFVIAKSDDALDATAFQPRKYNDAHRGMMILTSGFLNSPMSSSAKLGFVAHEMAHLFLWHLDANITPIRVTYKSTEITSESQIAFQNWLLLSQVIGWLTHEQSNAITFDSEIGKSTDLLFDKMLASKNPGCGDSLRREIETKWQTLSANLSRIQWDFVFDTPEKINRLNLDTGAMIQSMKACADTLDKNENRIAISPYHRLTFILSGLSSELPPSDLTLDQFVKLIVAAKMKLREYQRQFDRNQLRYYSAEDQADEVSLSVLRKLNLSSQDFLEALLGSLQEDKARCDEILKTEVEPPYGNLIDNHHATCWRVWHLRSFDRNFSTVPGLK